MCHQCAPCAFSALSMLKIMTGRWNKEKLWCMKHSEIIWHIRAAKIANKLPRETELENTEDLKHNPAHCSAHWGVLWPHKVFEEWSMFKTQTNKCFSKRNPMLNTGKVTTNRSCLHSAYSSKLELPSPNNLDCKAGRWRSGKIMVYWQIWEGRHLGSWQASELKPHRPLNSPEFCLSKVGIRALWRKGHGWPVLILQQSNFQGS